MGRAGRAAAKYGTHGAGTSGEFPSGKRLGKVYGCGDTGGECAGQTDCISAMGKACTE